MYPILFTTVWVEFRTIEAAHAYYAISPYPARLSPACDRSVDVKIPGHCIPTGELYRLPGVVKRPDMFVLGSPEQDPVPFTTLQQRLTRLAA